MIKQVQITGMSYGPDAIGRLDSGKCVFVRGGVPGKACTVEITKETARYDKGVAVGTEQAERTEQAPAISPWEYLPYDMQLDAKQAIVKDALLRNAHLEQADIEAAMGRIVPCKREWGYRNKLEFAISRGKDGRITVGFNDADSNEVVPIDECRLGNGLIQNAPRALTGALRFIEGREGDLGIFRIGVRGSLSTKSVEVSLWTDAGPFPRAEAAKVIKDACNAASVVRVIADRGASRRVRKVEVLGGEGFWRENIMVNGEPVAFRVSAPSFFQVNTAQAAKLVGAALGSFGQASISDMRICDLYSGVGTFSIPFALAGADVTAVELEGSSARDFRRNCELDHADAEIICDDASRVVRDVAQTGIDGFIVDPPRSGLDRRVMSTIAKARPQQVVYISCDPQTFARDARRFADHGYRLVSVTPVDMFPQTYHVETVGVFVPASDFGH